jgi:tetratricopeptide (TPR) repeat protein
MRRAARLFLLLLGSGLAAVAGEVEETLARADALAAACRAEREPAPRARAADAALRAYDAVIALRPKDPEVVPRVRRRRASLLAALGRPADALREHDRILEGPGSRSDRARALLDGASLLRRANDFHGAERRCARLLEAYCDEAELCARATLFRGECLLATGRTKEAEACFRGVVDRHAEEVAPCIAAYDALALLEIEAGRPERARAWLRACAERFEKHAARGDRYGAMVGRLLGEMKAPGRLQGG